MKKFHALLWAVQLSIFQPDFGQAKPTENGEKKLTRLSYVVSEGQYFYRIFDEIVFFFIH